MINLSLDHHDFLCAIEGFARGSHLRQHVWEEIVYRSIPQMTDDEQDFLWFMLRRNLWECYFWRSKVDGPDYKVDTHVGYDDYMHALAALHRGNRWKVKFRSETDKKIYLAICYRFNEEWHPLFLCNGVKGYSELQPYAAYIPDEWIKSIEKLPIPDNRYVEQGKEQWWNNIEVYDIDFEKELPIFD